jgi:DNA-binding GntR family transcriptional regulator
MLEGAAGVDAAARMSGEDFAAVHRIVERIHDALHRDNYMDFMTADLEFHRKRPVEAVLTDQATRSLARRS